MAYRIVNREKFEIDSSSDSENEKVSRSALNDEIDSDFSSQNKNPIVLNPTNYIEDDDSSSQQLTQNSPIVGSKKRIYSQAFLSSTVPEKSQQFTSDIICDVSDEENSKCFIGEFFENDITSRTRDNCENDYVADKNSDLKSLCINILEQQRNIDHENHAVGSDSYGIKRTKRKCSNKPCGPLISAYRRLCREEVNILEMSAVSYRSQDLTTEPEGVTVNIHFDNCYNPCRRMDIFFCPATVVDPPDSIKNITTGQELIVIIKSSVFNRLVKLSVKLQKQKIQISKPWAVLTHYDNFFLYYMEVSAKDILNLLIRPGIISDTRLVEVVSTLEWPLFADSRIYDQMIITPDDTLLHVLRGFALETLKTHLRPGNQILIVGTGAGWLPACAALLIGESGRVIAIDSTARVEQSINNMSKDKRLNNLLRSGNFVVRHGDGRLGESAYQPFNAIYVDIHVPYIPQRLIDQLAPGGKLLYPIRFNDSEQTLVQIDKDFDSVVTRQDISVFSPVELMAAKNSVTAKFISPLCYQSENSFTSYSHFDP